MGSEQCYLCKNDGKKEDENVRINKNIYFNLGR